MTEQSNFSKLKNSAALKVVSILVMIILLLIPNGLVQELINERSARKVDVENGVAASYGQEQIVYPAFIKIPYVRTQINDKDKPYTTEGYIGVSSNNSVFDASVTTAKRKRSIFEVIVYETKLSNNSNFTWKNLMSMYFQVVTLVSRWAVGSVKKSTLSTILKV